MVIHEAVKPKHLSGDSESRLYTRQSTENAFPETRHHDYRRGCRLPFVLALPYAPKNKPHSSQIWKTSTGVVVFGECISPVGTTLGKRRAGTVFLESELSGA